MADTELQNLSAATPVATDEIEFLDKSDTGMSAGGSNKRTPISDVLTLYSGPFVGTFTVKKVGTSGTDEFTLNPITGTFAYQTSSFVDLKIYSPDSSNVYLGTGSTPYVRLGNSFFIVGSSHQFGFADGPVFGGSPDAYFTRTAAGVVKLTSILELPQVASGGTPSTNSSRIYAKDVSGNAELFVKDEAGTETQVSPHSVDGPASLYDTNDSLPHVVKEANYYLGGVRYLNLSRACMLLEDLLKAIAAGQTLANIRTFLTNRGPGFIDIYRVESFASHNTRLGLTGENALVRRDWSDDQDAKQAEYDAARESELIAHAEWVEGGEGGTEPTVRPVADIRKPVPTWLSSRGVAG